MKNNYSADELRFSLPDYVSGRIKDKDLSDEIEKMISVDPVFRNEAAELKSTFNFLDNAELEKPSDIYFNNLSARINEKTGHGKEKELNFFEKYIFSRKLLIPLIPAVLVIVFLLAKNYTGDNNITVKNVPDINLTTEKQNAPAENYGKNNNNAEIPEVIAEDKTGVKNHRKTNEFKSKRIQTENTFKPEVLNNTEKDFKTETESEINGNLFADNFAETDNIDDDDLNPDLTDDENIDEIIDDDFFDDGKLENEFMELSPEDQSEILESLKKSKI